MRSLDLVTVGLVSVGLGLGNPLAAQTVKPADLVGQWAGQEDKAVRITFRADSTLTNTVVANRDTITGTGRWRLVGDTLVARPYVITVKGKKRVIWFDRRVVALKGNQLTMTKVEKVVLGPKSRVYERVSSSTP